MLNAGAFTPRIGRLGMEAPQMPATYASGNLDDQQMGDALSPLDSLGGSTDGRRLLNLIAHGRSTPPQYDDGLAATMEEGGHGVTALLFRFDFGVHRSCPWRFLLALHWHSTVECTQLCVEYAPAPW
eukprot:349801-Chlamydomonas_euryale.AAC.43